jgi:hypothetical protein
MNTKIVPGPGCTEMNRGLTGDGRFVRTIVQNRRDPLRSWAWIQERNKEMLWHTVLAFAPSLPPKEE